MSYIWVLFEKLSSQSLPMCGVRSKETFLYIYLGTTHFYKDPDEDWNELPKELPKKLLSKLPLVPGMLLSVLVLGAKWPPNPAMFRIRW